MVRLLLLTLAVLACSTATVPAAGAQPEFALYLLRHAEKTEEANDPGLTDAGRQRAQRMARWFSGQQIAAIWSSDYLRSRATAQPLADLLNIPIRLYDPQQLDVFSAELLQNAETALVVGHSNTTPELASLLCGCPVEAMPDDEYERFFRVTVNGPDRQLLKYDHPWVRDVHMPVEGIYHRAAMVAVSAQAPLALAEIQQALGTSQLLKKSRLIVLFDDGTDLVDWRQLYWKVINNVDCSRLGSGAVIDARSAQGALVLHHDPGVAAHLDAQWRRYGLS